MTIENPLGLPNHPHSLLGRELLHEQPASLFSGCLRNWAPMLQKLFPKTLELLHGQTLIGQLQSFPGVSVSHPPGVQELVVQFLPVLFITRDFT